MINSGSIFLCTYLQVKLFYSFNYQCFKGLLNQKINMVTMSNSSEGLILKSHHMLLGSSASQIDPNALDHLIFSHRLLRLFIFQSFFLCCSDFYLSVFMFSELFFYSIQGVAKPRVNSSCQIWYFSVIELFIYLLLSIPLL